MTNSDIVPGEDVSAAGWIAPRLDGPFGTVTRTVPSGFPAYVRICHPAVGVDGRLATWSEVVQTTGRRAHPLMQWSAMTGWPGNDPERGHLVPAVLGPLCDILRRHTTTPEACFFCVWDGWGAGVPETVSRVRHPGRDYVLVTGPLDAAPRFKPQSPNLFWPADQAWCVATEIDFDSTLVAGTAELAGALLSAPGIDAWSVEPGDSLAVDGDRINSVG
jgi:hypothetical protein